MFETRDTPSVSYLTSFPSGVQAATTCFCDFAGLCVLPQQLAKQLVLSLGLDPWSRWQDWSGSQCCSGRKEKVPGEEVEALRAWSQGLSRRLDLEKVLRPRSLLPLL